MALSAEDVAGRIRSHLDREGEAHVRFDFDGTVSELQVYPDESVPHPAALQAYEALSSVPGLRVGPITGRFLDFAVQHFPASFDFDCSYGMESMHDGVVWRHPELVQWRAALDRFLDRMVLAITEAGGASTFHAREAAEHDLIYIERKPAGIGLHDSPARSTHPETQVPALMLHAIDLLHDDYEGLLRHDNNGNVEFAAPLAGETGTMINKGTVVDALSGFVVFSADDSGDLPAAHRVKERSGLVLAVNNRADHLRRGTPTELLGLADHVFDSVADHAHFMAAVAGHLTN